MTKGRHWTSFRRISGVLLWGLGILGVSTPSSAPRECSKITNVERVNNTIVVRRQPSPSGVHVRVSRNYRRGFANKTTGPVRVVATGSLKRVFGLSRGHLLRGVPGIAPPRYVRGRERGRKTPADGVEPAHRVHVVHEHHHQGHVQVQSLAEHPHVVGHHEELQGHVQNATIRLEKWNR